MSEDEPNDKEPNDKKENRGFLSEEAKYRLADYIFTAAQYWIIGVSSGVLIGNSIWGDKLGKYISQEDKVKSGYALPKNITIPTPDLDKDGELETVIKYKAELGEKEYLVFGDNKGNLRLQEFKVETTKPKINTIDDVCENYNNKK